MDIPSERGWPVCSRCTRNDLADAPRLQSIGSLWPRNVASLKNRGQQLGPQDSGHRRQGGYCPSPSSLEVAYSSCGSARDQGPRFSLDCSSRPSQLFGSCESCRQQSLSNVGIADSSQQAKTSSHHRMFRLAPVLQRFQVVQIIYVPLTLADSDFLQPCISCPVSPNPETFQSLRVSPSRFLNPVLISWSSDTATSLLQTKVRGINCHWRGRHDRHGRKWKHGNLPPMFGTTGC